MGVAGKLWDATIEPGAKMTAASLGYIGVNFVAFPSMVLVQEGVTTTKLAVEVTWDVAKTGYDLVAPTGIAAVAGVYAVVDSIGSHAVQGIAVTGNILGYGEAGLGKAAGIVVKGGGYAAGKGVQYIGVPLASAGCRWRRYNRDSGRGVALYPARDQGDRRSRRCGNPGLW